MRPPDVDPASRMPFEEDQIRHSVEALWATVLGLAIEPRPLASTPGLLTGCVEITGAWQGAVTLDCGPSLALQVASIMFGVEPERTSSDQVQDALGELTNILGGQVKALLPGPCRLSLPAVAPRDDDPFHALHDRVVASLDFACQGAPVRVTIVEGRR